MFLKRAEYSDYLEIRERKRLKNMENIKCDKHTSSNKTCYILKFIQLIDSTIYNINKYNTQLWMNEMNFYKYYLQCAQLYDDLFDIFFYFGWYLGNEDKHNYDKNESCYFYESILTWITVQFMDKLPVTPQFIGEIGFRGGGGCGLGIVYEAENRCHLDWGGVSFIEFFITFKTHMAMQYPFFKRINYNRLMQGNHFSDLIEENFAAYFYDSLCLSDNWFDYIGFWRINFVLSMYFLSNDKHLGHRDHLVNAMLMFNRKFLAPQVVQNKIYINDVRCHDISLNRLQFMFLYDARPFGPIRLPCDLEKCNNKRLIKPVHFNPWTWISLYENDKNDTVDNLANDCENKFAILSVGRAKNLKLVAESKRRKKTIPYYRNLKMNDEVELCHVEDCLRQYFMIPGSFKYCMKSCNYEHESLNDVTFQNKIKQMMELLHNNDNSNDNDNSDEEFHIYL